jgi:anti-sigma regulatory factor (Ser/Thr protein kinase)
VDGDLMQRRGQSDPQSVDPEERSFPSAPASRPLGLYLSARGATEVLAIHESSAVGHARREAVRFASAAGLPDDTCAKIAIAVTEAASNILKHAGEGWLVLQRPPSPNPVFEALALDQGGGIRNLGAALRGGFSTAGSAGHGLSAITRLADSFEIHAPAGGGTAVLMRFHDGAYRTPFFGALNVAKSGEPVCGDAWGVRSAASSLAVAMADGTGHGPEAARSARIAVETSLSHSGAPRDALDRAHAALQRETRGAAVSMLSLQYRPRRARFAGLGNVLVFVTDGEARRGLLSRGGIVGKSRSRPRESQADLPVGSFLVAHTDGIRNGWSLAEYPGLMRKEPLLVAAVLWRDWHRGNDDSTVLVVRPDPPSD